VLATYVSRTTWQRSFAVCPVGLCAVLLATPASAAEPAVAIEPPASTTCVNPAELRDALVRAGVALAVGADYSADTIRDPFPTAPSRVLVTLRGTPRALAVTITRRGVAQTQSLPAATCETATDATAAFLVSALAPAVAPALPYAAKPTLEAPNGGALAPPACTDLAEPARLKALRAALERVPRREPAWLAPSLEVFLGTLALAGPSLEAGPQSRGALGFSLANSLLVYTSGVLLIGGGVGGYAAGPDRGTDLMIAALFAGQGAFFATTIVPDSTVGRVARTSGLFLGAALATPNIYRGRPLARAHAESDELKAGHVSRARAAQIEMDLREVDPLIPTWFIYAAPTAGFALAAVADLTDSHEPALDGKLNVGIGAVYLMSVLFAAAGTVWGPYERSLERRGLQTLSLGPGPGRAGLSLTGTF